MEESSFQVSFGEYVKPGGSFVKGVRAIRLIC